MAFNGSGTFVRLYSWITDAANGIFVSSVRMDADTNDIATGLSTCITKDGQTTITANIPMSGFKITGMAQGTAANDAAIVANANALNLCEFRLTLTSGTPVTTADVTGATTIYASPYKGNHIALYSGSVWIMRTSAEFSLALGTLSSGKPYDVFCYDNSGVPTLEFLVWTSDTARATALTLQDGVLVKTGATTRRYMGTFYTTAATTTEDSLANRYLFNYYNRVRRPCYKQIDGTGYTYTTNTIRQARASTANQLNILQGVAEDSVSADVWSDAANTNVGVEVQVGVGLDSTTAYATGSVSATAFSQVANIRIAARGGYRGTPAAGRHALTWLESSAATGTSTWNASAQALGMFGEIMA